MPSYESSVTIGAPAAKVWGVVSNVAAWHLWLPTVSKIDPLDGGALEIGRRFVVHQPKLKPATWKVTQLDPHRLFAWESRILGLRSVAEHAVSPEPAERTKVVLRMSLTGLFSGMAAKRFGSIIEDCLAQEAAAFKRAAEALP